MQVFHAQQWKVINGTVIKRRGADERKLLKVEWISRDGQE
jgi:hypothetical protein